MKSNYTKEFTKEYSDSIVWKSLKEREYVVEFSFKVSREKYGADADENRWEMRDFLDHLYIDAITSERGNKIPIKRLSDSYCEKIEKACEDKIGF